MRVGTLVLVLVVAASAACAGGSDISGERRNIGGVTVTFRVEPSAARVGQSVRLTLRLVNNSGTIEHLTFPSGKRYDFWVMDGPDEVWRWSDDQAFIQAIVSEEIEGQGAVVYDEIWTPERTGAFVAHASVEAEGYAGELTGRLDVS